MHEEQHRSAREPAMPMGAEQDTGQTTAVRLQGTGAPRPLVIQHAEGSLCMAAGDQGQVARCALSQV